MTEEKNASVEPAKPAKSNNTVLIVILVILGIMLILGVGGCFLAGSWIKKQANKIEVNTNSNGEGTMKIGDTTVDTNKGQSWPTDIPSSIPKFQAGKIEASAKVNNVWSISITGITDNDFTSYKNTLTQKGWKVDDVNIGTLLSFSATNSSTGYVISATMTTDDNGVKALILGISLESTPTPTE